MLTKRKTTYLSNAKEQMMGNQEVIKNFLDLDDERHNFQLFNAGMKFLSAIVNEGTIEFYDISTSKLYWNWFRLEFSHLQGQFIRHLNTVRSTAKHHAILNKMYECNINQFIISEELFASFDNFLKLHTNGK